MVYRKDGQYWVETWGWGREFTSKILILIKNLTTSQMEQMESCKQYVDRFVKANDGKMAGVVEGFFFKDDEFYLYTSRGEAVSVDDIYSVRDATNSDRIDYGNISEISELQKLNLQKAIEN